MFDDHKHNFGKTGGCWCGAKQCEYSKPIFVSGRQTRTERCKSAANPDLARPTRCGDHQ